VSEHYSLARARRSLAHFGIGKLMSAAAGVVALLLSIWMLPAAEYGWLVTLLAVLEIFYLFTGFGLSTVVQRYVTDCRIRASQRCFREFVLKIVLWRLLTAAIGGLIVLALMEPLLQVLGMDSAPVGAIAFVSLLCVGSLLRFMDEILPALLLQGHAQISLILRNLLKAVAYLLPWWAGASVTLADAVLIELSAALLALIVALVVLMRYLTHPHAEGVDTYQPTGMWSVSTRFYLVQIIGQIYGTNALKLLVMRILGPEATGALGFAQSVVDMIRNYLPAHLLSGWVRPLMVSRYVENKNAQEIAELAWMIFKLNLFGIIPLAVFFALFGDEAGALASGGKFPAVGALFLWLTILLVFQTAHLLVSLLTVTLARPAANLLATIFACAGLPLAWLIAPSMGVVGVVLSLIVAEIIWVGIVVTSLVRARVILRLDTSGVVPMTLTGVALWYAGALLPRPDGLPVLLTMFCAAAAIGIAFMGLLAFFKPLLPRERQLLTKFLPSRLLIW
jgi:O-antigen/teichoic acid export membrane protein